MIRSPHDGAHLVAPQAQSGSSARVLSATSGNTPRETTPTEVAIPGPSLIVTTMEGDLAANQPNPAARSAGATTSGSEAVNEDSGAAHATAPDPAAVHTRGLLPLFIL